MNFENVHKIFKNRWSEMFEENCKENVLNLIFEEKDEG